MSEKSLIAAATSLLYVALVTSVSTRARGRRLKRLTPSNSSRPRIWWLSALGVILMRKGVTYRWRWLLWAYVFSVLGPQIANQVGWVSAEVGRQPWIVYGLLRTRDAFSPTVPAGNVLFSLILFIVLLGALVAVTGWLMVKAGTSEPKDEQAAY